MEAIASKKPPVLVRELALGFKMKLIAEFSIPTAPKTAPDLVRGKEIYVQHCSQCHGLDGKADTELAKTMNPPPRAFADPETLGALTPFKAFNTITFGIEGTAMPAFAAGSSGPNLSEENRWAVATYLFQFGNSTGEDETKKAAVAIDSAIAKVHESMKTKSLDLAVSAYLDGFTLPKKATVEGLLGLNFLNKFNLSLFFKNHFLEIR